MQRNTLLTMLAVLLSACSSKPVYVEYSSTSTALADWYPIPTGAPSRVPLQPIELPRVAIAIEPDAQPAVTTPLAVEQLEDSLGNITLRLNRPPAIAWELVDSALQELSIELVDKDRSEYIFELKAPKGRSGWQAFFAQRPELKLVLIPQLFDTLLAVEGADEIAIESALAEPLLDQLLQYFSANRS